MEDAARGVRRDGGLLLDVRLAPGAAFAAPVDPAWAAFAYVYEGGGELCGAAAEPRTAYVLGAGERAEATAGAAGLRFLLVAARPIGEPVSGPAEASAPSRAPALASSASSSPAPPRPLTAHLPPPALSHLQIVQMGPFVMNSDLEIAQAVADYRSGALQRASDDVWAGDEGEL